MSYEPTNWKKGDKVTSTRLNKIEQGIQGNDTEISDLKEGLQDIDERVEALEAGGTGGGISMTAVNLLNTILSEAVYGTDQTANIALLKKELSNVAPVSISAVLDGTALAGQSYSELSFIVTATFDDESTAVVDNYTVVTTGTVAAGSNTVTIKYRGVTTICTFTAESVTTYGITYNLTNATSSNDTTVVVENSRYATEISTDSDHYIGTFTVTMGGVDVTATVRNGNNIVIDEVTGNVVITVTANAYVYLDPLILKRPYTNEGDSTVYLYTDEYATSAGTINYRHVGRITEYPAKYDCTLNWTITNTSGSAVALTNLGFGLIKNTEQYMTNNAIAYWQKIDNAGHSLEAGASISGTYQMRAGWQLILTVTTENIDAISESIRGDYVAETFSDYTTVYTVNSETPNISGQYRTYNYYSDNGETSIMAKNGYPLKVAENLSVGTYDIATRLVYTSGSSADGAKYSRYCIGAMTDVNDTASNYAMIAKAKYLTNNVWYTGQIRVTDNGSYLTTNGDKKSNLTEALAGHIEVRMKEVSA